MVIGYQVERKGTQGLVTIHILYNPCCTQCFSQRHSHFTSRCGKVSTWWYMKIVERWDNAKESFLKYLPEKKKYKKSLPKNSHYQCFVKSLKEEITTLAGIEFLIGVALVFNTYLWIFQWEGPLVHCLLEEVTTLLYQLVGWFIKENEINECKSNKDLLTLNVADAGTQKKLENIDYGTKTKKTT